MNTLELQSIVFIFGFGLEMLVTHAQQELVRHPFHVTPKEKIWKLVNLELEIPYFLVCYEVGTDDVAVRQTAMFWQISDVIVFCNEMNLDAKVKLTQVNLLTPTSSKSKRRWRLDVIKEVWEMWSGNERRTVTGFISESGKIFLSPRSSTVKDDFEQVRLLFSI